MPGPGSVPREDELLPQPGGFEGFGLAHVSLGAQDLSPSEGEDRPPPHVGVDLHVPRSALGSLDADHGGAVADVDDLFQLVVDPAEDLPALASPDARSFVASERSPERK